MKLNPEQQAAVDAAEGYFQTLAAAGSGKTAVLTERYKRVVERGCKPENILCMTFTSEAAKEMGKRAGIQTGRGRASGFCTFHAFALSVATRESYEFPFRLDPFPLLTEGQANKFLADAARHHKLDFRVLRNWVSLQKRNRITADAALKLAEKSGEDRMEALAYVAYDKACKDAGQLDFDSLILEVVLLLETKHDVRARYQYRYVQVDEAQDADELQWRLVQLLTEQYRNVFAVGDVNQNIYQFRGSDPKLFLQMGERFPGCRTLLLSQNYRSTPQIVGFCRKIAPTQNELTEKLWSANPAGNHPTIMRYANEREEAGKIVTGLTAGTAIGGAYKSLAILGRTNRCLHVYEDFLAQRGIAYHLLGHSGFYSQPEIQNVLAYLACAVFPNDLAVTMAIRTPFHPTRFMNKRKLLDDLNEQKENGNSYWETLQGYSSNAFAKFLSSISHHRNLRAKEAVIAIMNDLKAIEYYRTEEESVDNSPAENLQELIQIAGRFDTLRDLLSHIRKAQAAAKTKTGVALGTIHSAKGKEWETVYVVQVREGMLPHDNATNHDEEARLFYVACSRAERYLHISYTDTASRFITPYLYSPPTTEQFSLF